MAACLCTLAIHPPYRQRARLLVSDAPSTPWVIATDVSRDFADLAVRIVFVNPSGPMAVDYLEHLAPTGEGRGAAAYHDKRFALRAALEHYDTAIFLDADSRLGDLPPWPVFPPGLAVLPVVRKSIAEHLDTCGSWRLPVFMELAHRLTGTIDVLDTAPWCHETCYAVTRDGREGVFFAAWDEAAAFMRDQRVYSGEGGVMGLAAACAGWATDYDLLLPLGDALRHEGGGPKRL
jgi:hypothetical protein